MIEQARKRLQCPEDPLLWEYENAVGRIGRDDPLVPPHPVIERFAALLRTEWQRTLAIVEEARRREAERQAKIK